MVAKYVRLLEERDINDKTNAVWAIQDVPKTWRAKVQKQVLADGFEFSEDGTVVDPNAVVEETPAEKVAEESK